MTETTNKSEAINDILKEDLIAILEEHAKVIKAETFIDAQTRGQMPVGSLEETEWIDQRIMDIARGYISHRRNTGSGDDGRKLQRHIRGELVVVPSIDKLADIILKHITDRIDELNL